MSIFAKIIEDGVTGLIVKRVSPPELNPPEWDSQPAPNFTFGTPNSYDVGALASDVDNDLLSYSLNTGSVSLPTGVSWDTGVSGDGAGRLEGGVITDLNFGTTDDFSYEFRVKNPGGESGNCTLISKLDGSNDGFYCTLTPVSGTLNIAFAPDGGGISSIGINNLIPSDNSYYHVAICVDRSAGGYYLYVNGESLSGYDPYLTGNVDTSKTFNSSGNFSILDYDGFAAAAMPSGGIVDDVRIWGEVRTQQQVQDNMNIELDASASENANLLCYWKMNGTPESSVATVSDETANNNDLTASSASNLIYKPTGRLVYNGIGSSSTTTGHVATVSDGIDETFSSEFSIFISAESTSYPNSNNVFTSSVIGSIDRLTTTTEPAYMWANVAPTCLLQILALDSPSARQTTVDKWKALKTRNPLWFGIFHQQHFSVSPSYRNSTTQSTRYIYDIFQNHNRNVGMLYIDSDTASTEFNGNQTPISAFITMGCTPRFTYAPIRDDLSDLAVDSLTGSNLAGFGFGDNDGTDDISDFNGWYHDATQLLFFGYNKKLTRPYTNGTGTIVSVDSTSGSQIRQVTITNQPGSGVIGEVVFFFPHNDAKKFIGYQIENYSESGGNAILTLEALPGTAGTQSYIPAANHRVCINNRSNRSGGGDWNASGTTLGPVESADTWCPAWLSYWDEINTKINAQNSLGGSGAGWNAVITSFTEKELRGWKTPHQLSNSSDYSAVENGFHDMKWTQNSSSSSHDYDISQFDPLKTMRMIHFAETWLNPNPNAFMQEQPRGIHVETTVWGLNHNDINALDASTIRHHLALLRTVPGMAHSVILSGANNPVAIDEHFLDFDTDYTPPEPIVTYDEGGGAIGSNGGPIHTAVWKTPDAGERIYVRRLGNFLVVINAADFPGGYGTFYSPSHLAGGFTPRATNDEITAANWTTIISNYLNAGEALRHINPSTYINSPVTSFMRTQQPTIWGDSAPGGPYNYGPRQSHPNDGDGTYTLANTPAIARDDTLNDGSTVNTGSSYYLGPQESVFLEIYTP